MTLPYTIEIATWRDLNAVRQVEQISFPKDMWPIWDIVGVLTMSNIVRLKAVSQEKMAGFVAGDIRGSEDLSWIATIAVLPEFRGHGIGRALLEACEARLPTSAVRLCVRPTNEPAIQLYLSSGYYRLDLWKNYYQDGESALVMEKMR